MHKRPGSRILAAALAVLVMGITAGLARHACELPAAPRSPAIPETTVPQERNHPELEGLCAACVLSAQFSSLGLPGACGVLQPQPAGAVGATQQTPASTLVLPIRSARGPPAAFPDPSAV